MHDDQQPTTPIPPPRRPLYAVGMRLWHILHQRQRVILRSLLFLTALLLLTQAIRLLVQPDMRDELRRADAFFQLGHYHTALQHYLTLAEAHDNAEVALRIGMIRAIRGELIAAEHSLRRAMGYGLHGEEHDLAVLYLGQVLNERGERQEAVQVWGWIAPESSLDSVRRVLRAELALRQGDYAAAEADYRAARTPALPADWHTHVAYRLGLLRAARDARSALDELTATQNQSGAFLSQSIHPNPLLSPLVPYTKYDRDHLVAILQADARDRSQLLGQLYLDLNLFALAEAQFTQVAPDSPHALAAAAYAAYTRWLAGDMQGGLIQLEDLVAAYPDESRARTLLALVYLAQEDTDAARAQIDTIAMLAPENPDTHLAWANWYVAQRDYVQASDEYQRALAQATPDQRGRYALLVARFHLTTTYQLCERGLPAAEVAATALPADAEAWTTLAASRYHCGEFADTVTAARQALDITADADAAFYLGAALADQGEWVPARRALVQAADLDPDSIWRERAEERLALMR